MDYRNTVLYKGMTSYIACSIIEGFCDSEPTEDEVLIAWQYLHDTKQAYSLQGSYGRGATCLVESGAIKK